MKFAKSDMKKIIILLSGVSVLFFSGCVCTKNQCSVGNTDNFVKIGWAKQDITPAGPTFLGGQHFIRLAFEVKDPLFTSAMAVESGNEKFIMLSLDSTRFSAPLMDKVRKKVSKATGVPEMSIIGFATHTHTAPQYGEVVPKEFWNGGFKPALGIGSGTVGVDIEEFRKKYPDLVDSKDYFFFLADKISDAAIEAWNNRKFSKIAYGMGEAAVGECRRLVVGNKGGVMYADEAVEKITHAEGHVDHSLNIMATYSLCGKLTGLIINLACPSQVYEAHKFVSSDFWGNVRREVAAKYGKDVVILPQCSPAGDQAPHKLLNRKADARMMLLRGQLKNPVSDWTWSKRAFNEEYNLARSKEISRRIMSSLNEVLPVIRKSAVADPVVKHQISILQLPPRHITKAEYDNAVTEIKNIETERKKNNITGYSGRLNWHRRVVDRYKNKAKSVLRELHVFSIGGAAFATNTFELYLDYGDRIKGASKAEQTFLIQLASAEAGSYLPSRRSGTTGYGSAPASCIVVPEAGDMIVKESVKAINGMF